MHEHIAEHTTCQNLKKTTRRGTPRLPRAHIRQRLSSFKCHSLPQYCWPWPLLYDHSVPIFYSQLNKPSKNRFLYQFEMIMTTWWWAAQSECVWDVVQQEITDVRLTNLHQLCEEVFFPVLYYVRFIFASMIRFFIQFDLICMKIDSNKCLDLTCKLAWINIAPFDILLHSLAHWQKHVHLLQYTTNWSFWLTVLCCLQYLNFSKFSSVLFPFFIGPKSQ